MNDSPLSRRLLFILLLAIAGLWSLSGGSRTALAQEPGIAPDRPTTFMYLPLAINGMVQDPAAEPTPAASATPTPSTTPSPQPSTPTPPAQAGILDGIAVLGDSFYDEYQGSDHRGGAYFATTFNLVELLQRLRGFDFGPWGTWGEPRRTGYEYNWARSGATSGTMIQQNQHVKAAAQVAAGKVSLVFIGIGANDFSPSFSSDYRNIYDGTMSDVQVDAKVNKAIADVTLAVATVQDAGAQGVIATLFTEWGLDPQVAKNYPDAAKRARVDTAIDRVNAGIQAMAAARGVVVVDQNAIGVERILPQLDSQGNLTVGGEKISFLVNGDEPHHVKLGDGVHTGTVLSGLLANWYFVDPLNAAFDTGLAPLTDAEILTEAGVAAQAAQATAAATH